MSLDCTQSRGNGCACHDCQERHGQDSVSQSSRNSYHKRLEIKTYRNPQSLTDPAEFFQLPTISFRCKQLRRKFKKLFAKKNSCKCLRFFVSGWMEMRSTSLLLRPSPLCSERCYPIRHIVARGGKDSHTGNDQLSLAPEPQGIFQFMGSSASHIGDRR